MENILSQEFVSGKQTKQTKHKVRRLFGREAMLKSYRSLKFFGHLTVFFGHLLGKMFCLEGCISN
jgi:hypothetical protein